MWLQARMYLLIIAMFAILYGVIVGVGTLMEIFTTHPNTLKRIQTLSSCGT